MIDGSLVRSLRARTKREHDVLHAKEYLQHLERLLLGLLVWEATRTRQAIREVARTHAHARVLTQRT